MVLSPIFKADFIKKLGTTGYSFSNNGSFTVTSPKGEQITEKGKGKIQLPAQLMQRLIFMNSIQFLVV